MIARIARLKKANNTQALKVLLAIVNEVKWSVARDQAEIALALMSSSPAALVQEMLQIAIRENKPALRLAALSNPHLSANAEAAVEALLATEYLLLAA